MAEKTSDQGIAFLPHLLGLFTGFVGPLITYLVAKDATLKEHSKKALNWQFSLIIYFILSTILMFVSLIMAAIFPAMIVLIIISIFLLIALEILTFVFSIIALVKAGNGELWDYPMAIKFFK